MTKLAWVNTCAQSGIAAVPVCIEVHLSAGLPAFNLVGLPETTVRESKERVRSAILNSDFEFPSGRITINLAPADLPKEGGRFDLPIALGLLAASGQISKKKLNAYIFVGELALSGELRGTNGVLSAAVYCRKHKKTFIFPQENKSDINFFQYNQMISVTSLLHVCAFIMKQVEIAPIVFSTTKHQLQYADMSDIKGQMQAKQALIIAAAGGHHLLLSGPPGTGKTMLASRLPSILPPLSQDQAVETALIYSLSANKKMNYTFGTRPFRCPHHSSSPISLVGGGSNPNPGEISYAHHGVLFLDELLEFQRSALEMLREPLESNMITITRSKASICYPAHFQLVAAMNPCPCGYYGDHQQPCQCTPEQVRRYHSKLSGPMMDRIDLHVNVFSQNTRLLLSDINASNTTNNHYSEAPSTVIKKQVCAARERQIARQDKPNSCLSNKDLWAVCDICNDSRQFIYMLCDKMTYSARAMHRILKIARTLADLEDCERVHQKHLAEAVHFRFRNNTLR